MALLAKAERKLRAGNVSEAMNLFEEIVEGVCRPSSSSPRSRICVQCGLKIGR